MWKILGGKKKNRSSKVESLSNSRNNSLSSIGRQGSNRGNDLSFSYNRSSLSDAETERIVSNAARRLGENIQKIVTIAKMPSSADPNTNSNTEWKTHLLKILGNTEPTNPHDLFSDIDLLLTNYDSDKFVLRCMENELPPNLIHCLRLLRVLELQVAAQADIDAMNNTATATLNDTVDDANISSSIQQEQQPTTIPIPPKSEKATEKVVKLFCLLCTDPGVGEQLRPHLFGLLALSGASYPLNGLHVARGASVVISKFSEECLTNSIVHFLHDRNMIVHMTDDVKELCCMTNSVRSVAGTRCLQGEDAEESGFWVIALTSIVQIVKLSCNHGTSDLLNDFDSAGGYHVLCYAILNSSSSNLGKLLELTVSLVSCKLYKIDSGQGGTNGGNGIIEQPKRSIDSTIGTDTSEDRFASNPSAFEIIEDIIVRSIPFLVKYCEERKGSRPIPQSSDQILELAEMSLKLDIQSLQGDNNQEVIVEQISTKVDNTEFSTEILVSTLQIFSDHPQNFSIIEERYSVLSHYLIGFSSFQSDKVKTLIVKTLEYVCTALPKYNAENPLTIAAEVFSCLCKHLFELSAATVTPEQIKENGQTIDVLTKDASLICTTLEKLLQLDETFNQIMLNVGLMDEKLQEYISLITSPSQTLDSAPPIVTKADETYSLICFILDSITKNSVTISDLSSRGMISPRRSADDSGNHIHLNLFLTIGVANLGDKASDAALRVFDTKMTNAHDEALQNNMECLLSVLERFSDILSKRTIDTTSDSEQSNELTEETKNGMACVQRTCNILAMMQRTLETNSSSQDVFRSSKGFECLLKLLTCIDKSLFRTTTAVQIDDDEETKKESETGENEFSNNYLLLIQCIFGVLSASTSHVQTENISESASSTSFKAMDLLSENSSSSSPDKLNCSYLRDEGFYAAFVKGLEQIGALETLTYVHFVLNLALEILHPDLVMGSEDVGFGSEQTLLVDTISYLRNPDIIRLILGVIICLPHSGPCMGLATEAMDIILALCGSQKRATTLGQIAECGLCNTLTAHDEDFAQIYEDFNHPMYSRFVALLRRISSFKMSYIDFVGILRCIAGPILSVDGPQSNVPTSKRKQIKLPIISTFIEDQKIDNELISQDIDKDNCIRLETLVAIAEKSDKVSRCVVGGDSLNNIAFFMQKVRLEEKLFSLAEKGRISFVEIERVDASARSQSLANAGSQGPNSPSHAPEKMWSPSISSGFSFSLWLRLPPSCEVSNGNVFILDISSYAGDGISSIGHGDFLSVWYDYQSQGFNVLSSVSPKPICFPISPLVPGIWNHILLTFQPPKRSVLSRKAIVGLCVNGRPLEADIRIDSVSLPPTARIYIGVPNPILASSGVIRGSVATWELGTVLLLSTILGPRDAMSIFITGPDFLGQFWGDRPQRLSLAATASAAFSMLAEGGEEGGLNAVLKKRDIPATEVEAAGVIKEETILESGRAGYLDPDLLSTVGLFCKVTPGQIICAFRASASTDRMHDGSSSSNKRHYSRRLINIARINSANSCVSTDAVVYGSGSVICPSSFVDNVRFVGGPNTLLPILNAVKSPSSVALSLRLIRGSATGNIPNVEMLQKGGGYRILSFLLKQKQNIDASVLEQCFAFSIHGFIPGTGKEQDSDEATSSSFKRDKMPYSWNGSNQWTVIDLDAIKYLVLNHQIWDIQKTLGPDLALRLICLLNGCVDTDCVHAAFNARRLHLLGVVKWTLHFMLETAELYALGCLGETYSKTVDSSTLPHGDSISAKVLTLYKDGWISQTSSIASTAVGGDPGNPILLCCKTFLRRVLTYMLTADDLEAIAGAAVYTISIDSMFDDVKSQLGLDMKTNTQKENDDNSLMMGATVRIYLLRLFEELVVDGVNEIMTSTSKRDPDSGSLGIIDPHLGGGSNSNKSYFSKASRLTKLALPSYNENQKDKQAKAFLSAFSVILQPVWFACILEGCHEEASTSATFRLLILILQNSPSFATTFAESGGFAPLVLSIPKFSISPSITLSMLSQLLYAPILHLPCFGTLNSAQLCTVFDAESDASELIPSDNKQGGVMPKSDPAAGIFALLAECIGRNIQLSGIKNEMGSKAKQTNHAIVRLLCHRHTFSSQFQEFCRSPDFLEPISQTLCLINSNQVVNESKQQKSIDDDLSICLSEDSVNNLIKDDGSDQSLLSTDCADDDGFVDWPSQQDSSNEKRMSYYAEKGGNLSVSDHIEEFIPEYETGGLELLVHHVISHAVLSGPRAAALISAFFGSFPIHASPDQVNTFYTVLVYRCHAVVEDILQRGNTLALANCVGVVSVLLDRLVKGYFTYDLITCTVRTCIEVIKCFSENGTNASKELSKNDSDHIIHANAAHYARIICMIALHRSKNLDPGDPGYHVFQRDVLQVVEKNLKYILFSTQNHTNEQSISGNEPYPKPSPGTKKYQWWRSTSLKRCVSNLKGIVYPAITTVEEPVKAFIVSGMTATHSIFFGKDNRLREYGALFVSSLLKERFGIMSEILSSEIPLDGNIVESIDLLNEGGGFSGLLNMNREVQDIDEMSLAGLSTGGSMDEDAFDTFFEWLDANKSDVESVYDDIKYEVLRLIPFLFEVKDLTPRNALEDEQKEMLITLASQEASNKAILSGFERSHLAQASHDKTTESQAKWKRQGFNALSSGAINWKALVRQLKGPYSIWEGGTIIEEEKTLVSWITGSKKDQKQAGTKMLTDNGSRPSNNQITRWKLDVTEGYERQRRRMLPNYEFHSLYNIQETADLNQHEETRQSFSFEEKSMNSNDLVTDINLSPDNVEATAELLKQMHLNRTAVGDFFHGNEVEEDNEYYEDNEESWYYQEEEEEEYDEDEDKATSSTLELSSHKPPIETLELTNGVVPNDATPSKVYDDSINGEIDMDEEIMDPDDMIENYEIERHVGGLASNYDLITGLLQPGDIPEKSYNVKRCTGLEVRQAILIWCRNVIYIIDGFEQTDGEGLTGEMKRVEKSTSTYDVNLRPEGFQSTDEADSDTNIEAQSPNKKDESEKKDSKAKKSGHDEFTYQHRSKRLVLSEMFSVYRRRYQLQPIALELCDTHRNGTLIAFTGRYEREEVLAKILTSPLPNSIFHSIGPSINYDKFMNTLRAKTINKWVHGKMSNFDFIMHLNTFAGRSYNDLTQYPVFPWILKDYESEEIDLNDPSIYRDLSKPMGALGKERAVQFQERYEALESNYLNDDEPPPFHYGTHYSCAAYVLNYLFRLEPFSRLALSLQGGKFDLADRLFQNVGSSWNSASKDNLQDVRELIPEFFYLPEFLMNNNNFDLGVTQHGKNVHNVVLPPWAKGDPRRFIRIHRQALESDHVSRNLHKWIDLVFGYKQRGREAIASQNTFVHVTYEGAVDLEKLEDPIQRESTIAQIQNFGQTPSRLWGKPFPAKQVTNALKEGNIDLNVLNRLEHLTPPFCIVGAPDKVHLTHSNSDFCKVGMTGQSDSSVGDICILKGQLVGVGKTCALIPPHKMYCRFGGSSNGVSVHIALTSAFKEVDTVVSMHDDMHRFPISIAKPSRDGNWLVTGCKDSTVRIWKYHKDQMQMQLEATLCAHEGGNITSVDISIIFGMIVTGGTDGNVVLWDLRTLQFLRQLNNSNDSASKPVISASINQKTGDVVTLVGSQLTIFDINGKLVVTHSLVDSFDENSSPSCCISTDCSEWMENGVAAITGHNNGDVRLWSADRDNESLTMRHILQPKIHSCSITCIRVDGNRQDKLLVGDKSGKISVWNTVKLESLSQENVEKIVQT